MSPDSFPLPPLDQIPDDIDDAPKGGAVVRKVGGHYHHLQLPGIVFGAATFANLYNDDAVLESSVPLRTVRLALRYGIDAFDTSPFYGPSEIILGNALEALESQFPRASYQLMTKCGRYGLDISSFDYSPERIRASVNLSLRRLKTAYLDTVYLHDVEFVCAQVTPQASSPGSHHHHHHLPLLALGEEKESFGLAEGQEATIWGEGDRVVLAAMAELRKMQEEGLIKSVGITGYPLPTLLRLALLVLHTPPFKSLDAVLSYSHLTLQNTAFEAFIPHFRERAKVNQLVAASPLSNGLLTSNHPAWHPAPRALREWAADECERKEGWTGGGLPNIALGYSITKAIGAGLPLAVGFSHLREVHECVAVWAEVSEGGRGERRLAVEEDVRKRIGQLGFLDWSWAGP